MEQPPEEAPEVREEEKEEVAETQGAPELNGGPEHSLPSSSYTGEEAMGRGHGQKGQRGHSWAEQRTWPSAKSIMGVWSSRVVKHWIQTGSHPCCVAHQLQDLGQAAPPLSIKQAGIIGDIDMGFCENYLI